MAFPGLSLYKLMILYMLEKVTFPLSNNQIVDFLLNRNYTDYFHAQEAINDLLSDRHILSETQGNTTRYEITEEGSKTLGYLEGMISPEIRSEIPNEVRRWGGPKNWESMVDAIKDYARDIIPLMIRSIQSELGLTDKEVASYFGTPQS